MDIGEFEPFLVMGFNAPPVDQDIPPTFGTLLTCVSVCLRLLMKVQSTLVILTSVISNNRLSRRENLIPVLT